MINLDQVRTLEWKVKQAVQLIVHLRRENDTLRGRLSDTEVRLQEMDSLLESFKATQNEMESGIRSALEELDHLENEVPPASVPGPVDPVSYPPVVSAPVAPEPVVEAVVAPEVTVPSEEASSETEDRSFEEEYAALAAAEEASAGVVEEAPDSVELEDVAGPSELEEESLLFEAEGTDPLPEPAPVVPEEKQPEQPGLGIF